MNRVPPGAAGRAARLVAAAAAGAGLATAHPPEGWWPLVLPGLAVAIGLASTATPRRAALESLLAGFVAWGLLLRWFAAVLLEFTDLGPWVAAAAVVGAGLVEGLLLAGWGALAATVSRRVGPVAAASWAAAGWIGLEVLRERFPLPFPWGPPSAALAGLGAVEDLAAGIGSSGVDLLVALAAGACATLVSFPASRRRAGLLGLVVLAAVAAGLGAGRLGRSEGDVRVTVAAVQAALPREADAWDKFLAHERLTIEAARRGARLVVWPESAVPYRLDRHRGYRELVGALARRAGVDIVLNTIEADDAGRYYNAAALVRADGRPGGAYRKRRLVPFGEYLPLRSLFRRVPALAAQAGDFTPGAELVLLESRDGTVGPLVCYEAVFPALAADEAAAGADLLVNMTNDSWFGWTGGPAQHLAHARLRAAETGLPLVRAAYSGISAIFSDRGRELGRLGLGERGVLTAEVHVGGRAPGAAVGRALARLCATLAAVAAALVLVRARRADVAPDAEAGPAPEGTSRDEG